MATNWTLAQAKKVITEGTDLAAIADIGRRFPLTALAIAKIGDNEGATTIINALPEHITARKIESVLKDGIADSGANDDDDDDAEDAEHDEKPAKKNTKAKAKAKAETDDTTDDEDPIALYKKCKKAGLKVAPKKSAKYYKDALKKAQEAENEADGDADDWGDADDEEEKPVKKTGKAAAKKSKAKTEPEPEDEDNDEDEWDI